MSLRHVLATALAAAAFATSAPAASAQICVYFPKQEVAHLTIRPMEVCVL